MRKKEKNGRETEIGEEEGDRVEKVQDIFIQGIHVECGTQRTHRHIHTHARTHAHTYMPTSSLSRCVR